jgi:hypothetical protein
MTNVIHVDFGRRRSSLRALLAYYRRYPHMLLIPIWSAVTVAVVAWRVWG